mmetsp:Transcript_12768/g.27555  ORF Transcript_12768/g.27555 Transcript_12768/m.27555 type:complete len:411 (-) Transcript_12768:172-1404(-)|eukprot:CAMPEP_0183360962 /NCGR_PEP_ID=MMETSP0164_2-20130417/56172_1 /TAXON_ID=221442 /ORGANISM="Coccolithus pelagicus ssp braarudi, Strain PLY182g" /LENGTH=410 /DNA_ID=CAMNT_0025535413 /DNA_START=192 /DNA_END=1424 /DNA_ORIENTATION=-
MGISSSKQKRNPPSELTPAANLPAAPSTDRETTPLAEKELAAEFRFMLENMRMKQWAAEGNNYEQALRREDNHTFQETYTARTLPLDEDGFVQAHDLDDAAGIRSTFAELGVVVIRGAINSIDCARSVDELWSFLERQCEGLDRTNPRTWDRWPSLSKLGILGNTFVLSPQFFRNRQSPCVHRAFATLFGTERLHVNIGRASAMRPTRNVRLPLDETHAEEEVVDKPEWRSKAGEDWLHWDANPFTGATSSFSWRVEDAHANRGYERLRTQGILALSDCGHQDGGFFCVPGSHKVVRSWANVKSEAVSDAQVMSAESSMQIYLPKDDPLRFHAQRAPIRAGDLLIWDAYLVHCNFPNDSEQMRMVQYIQMKRADDPALGVLLSDPDLLPSREEFELTPLGERLFGLTPWD